MTTSGYLRGQSRRLFTGRLWSHRDFLRLWSGQSLSQVGTQITLLALPTSAIVLLGAGPAELGLLTALGFLTYPVFGPVAGVWADRLRRRPMMIVCDLLRFSALVSVPIAFAAGTLTMVQLYLVTAVVGAASTFFDVAYQAYLPTIINRSDVLEGNSKLEVSRSAAVLMGPAAAGLLVQAVTAAGAIAADALSYLASALTLGWIRSREIPVAREEGVRSFRTELSEGVRHLRAHEVLRRILACTATLNLGTGMSIALFLVFAYGDLRLIPGVVGIIFALGSVGTLLGASSAGALARRVSIRTILLVSAGATAFGNLLIPVATIGVPVVTLVASTFLVGMFSTIYNINHLSLRQQVVPDRLLGRVSATWRTISWGAVGLGAVAGGGLGSVVGVVPTLVAAAVLSTVAALWLVGLPDQVTGPVGRPADASGEST